jgi:hypothetical protein
VAMLSVSEDTAFVASHHDAPPERPVVDPEHPAHPVDHSSTTAQNDHRSDQPAVPTAAMPLMSRLSPTLFEFARPLCYAGRGACCLYTSPGGNSEVFHKTAHDLRQAFCAEDDCQNGPGGV